jgi:hypothetical protein
MSEFVEMSLALVVNVPAVHLVRFVMMFLAVRYVLSVQHVRFAELIAMVSSVVRLSAVVSHVPQLVEDVLVIQYQAKKFAVTLPTRIKTVTWFLVVVVKRFRPATIAETSLTLRKSVVT